MTREWWTRDRVLTAVIVALIVAVLAAVVIGYTSSQQESADRIECARGNISACN